MEDISNIIKELSNAFSNNSEMPDNIKELFNNFSNSSSQNSNNDSDNTNNFNIDFDTILKAKNIFSEMSNGNDPRKNLLLSLKPYLKDDKKEKIDKYIQFLTLSKIIETFGPDFFGSDKNV